LLGEAVLKVRRPSSTSHPASAGQAAQADAALHATTTANAVGVRNHSQQILFVEKINGTK